ncbi:hypothetical protein FB45DRAFT_1064016 [Roridomyces roridus]|uniref:Uncharacterized protein n=1 Tax=Roridomyces roridus TaxID=1738132 RepID=A0AAD7BCC7_9AGAR|nr:hypothetical protein FB45DRAFT_1064016 [Roridomyces roridus]
MDHPSLWDLITEACERSGEQVLLPNSWDPNVFPVEDETWPRVCLFGPIGRPFGALIAQYRHRTKDSIVILPGGPVDMRDEMRRAAVELNELHRAVTAPDPTTQVAVQYLDCLLRLESFLHFLLGKGYHALISINLLSDLHEYTERYFNHPRERRHTNSTHGAPRISIYVVARLRDTNLPVPASAEGADARGVIDPLRGLIFPSCFPPPTASVTPSSHTATATTAATGKRKASPDPLSSSEPKRGRTVLGMEPVAVGRDGGYPKPTGPMTLGRGVLPMARLSPPPVLEASSHNSNNVQTPMNQGKFRSRLIVNCADVSTVAIPAQHKGKGKEELESLAQRMKSRSQSQRHNRHPAGCS